MLFSFSISTYTYQSKCLQIQGCYQWEEEVVESSASVPAFGLGNVVVIFYRQPAGEGGIGSSKARVFSKSKQ